VTPNVKRVVAAALVAALALFGLATIRLELPETVGFILDGLMALGAAVAIHVASRRATRARSLRSWQMQRAAAAVWVVSSLLLVAKAPVEYAEAVRLIAVGCMAMAWWLASYSGDVWSRIRMAVDGGIAVASFFVITWMIVLRDVWDYVGGGLDGVLALIIPLLTVCVALFAAAVAVTEFRAHHRTMPLLFVIGLLTLAASDMLYAWGETPLWAVGWLLWIYATLAYRGTAARNEVVSTRQRFIYAPYIFVAPAVVYLTLERHHGVQLPVFLAASAMVVLLLVRQHVTLLENAVLVDKLAHTERMLRHQATHDHLTGLAGRVVLWERLAHLRALEDDVPVSVALLFVDLDDFKSVNDRHGHATGDHVLVETAQRLSDVLNSFGDDALGVRMSGDEFAVLLVGDPAREADTVAHRILDDVRKPINVNNLELNVGASLGVSLTSSRDLNPSELLRSADEAMYAIKHHGKGGVQIARPDDAIRDGVDQGVEG
jgi:diguanylate cyclase (GGDEF)-like protein